MTTIIVGPAGVGKSSLINLLAKKNICSVSHRPDKDGTLNIVRYPEGYIDTPGLDSMDDVKKVTGERLKEKLVSETQCRLVLAFKRCDTRITTWWDTFEKIRDSLFADCTEVNVVLTCESNGYSLGSDIESMRKAVWRLCRCNVNIYEDTDMLEIGIENFPLRNIKPTPPRITPGDPPAGLAKSGTPAVVPTLEVKAGKSKAPSKKKKSSKSIYKMRADISPFTPADVGVSKNILKKLFSSPNLHKDNHSTIGMLWMELNLSLWLNGQNSNDVNGEVQSYISKRGPLRLLFNTCYPEPAKVFNLDDVTAAIGKCYLDKDGNSCYAMLRTIVGLQQNLERIRGLFEVYVNNESAPSSIASDVSTILNAVTSVVHAQEFTSNAQIAGSRENHTDVAGYSDIDVFVYSNESISQGQRENVTKDVKAKLETVRAEPVSFVHKYNATMFTCGALEFDLVFEKPDWTEEKECSPPSTDQLDSDVQRAIRALKLLSKKVNVLTFIFPQPINLFLLLLQKRTEFPRLPGRMINQLVMGVVDNTSGSFNDDSGYSLYEACLRVVVDDPTLMTTKMNVSEKAKWQRSAKNTLDKMTKLMVQTDHDSLSMEQIFG